MMATVQEISISFHYASTLATSKAEFPVIVRALEQLKPIVKANQSSIYLPFCEFDYILPLVVCSHILHVVVLIAAMLHIIFCDLIEAVSECQILIRYLKTERNEMFTTLYMMKL